jgi:WD40 repeat protein
MWDLDIGVQKAVFELPDREERAIHYRDKVYKETVSAMLVLDDGRIIAGGLSGIVRVWNSSTGSLTTSWQAHFNGHKITGPVLNNILLHPSGVAFITTGTDGAVCLWDIQTYSLLRSIKPLDHSVLAVAWHGMTLICGGKDGGGVDNACGAFNKIVTWNVAQLRLEDGTEEKYEQLGPLCQSVRKIWSFGRHVTIIAMRKGLTGLELWSEEGS